MLEGKFVNLDAETLALLATDYTTCLRQIAANQSYSMAGRSFTKADLKAVSDTLAEIKYAQGIQAGTINRFVVADMT